MNGLNEKTTEKLDTLKANYFRKLPNRYNEIKKTSSDIIKGNVNTEKLQDLKIQIHKFAGSAATFGLGSLTDISRNFEEHIDGLLSGKEEWSEESARKVVQNLKSLREICANPVKFLDEDEQGFSLNGADEAQEKKIVFVLGDNDSVSKDLSEQLGYFGYMVEILNSFSSLKEHIRDAKNELLIMNSRVIEGNPKTAAAVKKIKDDSRRHLSIIYFSDNDDFDIRLECVRAGGDDYFTIPLDVSRLIDQVDTLTADDSVHPYHILIIDDDPEQVSFYALILQQAGMITSVASDPRKVLDILSESKPDLILMDMYMPGCDGMELSSIIRQQEAFVSIPIVFLSFETNREVQLEAIRLGADDFLTKPIKPNHLISSVASKAERSRQLRYFMERDSLTGLLNHTNVKEALYNELLRSERTEASLCFAMIDIDHFKQVNDVHGHMAGDRVLKSLSRLLQDRLRRTDIIGRYGGEEFAVILINTGIDNAVKIMDSIRQSFSQIRQVSSKGDFYVTFSCGIASFPLIKTADALNSEADQALYRAKDSGRNRIISVSRPAED